MTPDGGDADDATGSGSPRRAFDFWLGEWEVRDPDGDLAGTNVVSAELDGNLLVERWTGASGSEGASLNYYDPGPGEWVQVWVDATGGNIAMRGGVEDGSMAMEGHHVLADGERRPFRATFTPEDDGTVTQHLEESTDGGETWATWFLGHYHRRE